MDGDGCDDLIWWDPNAGASHEGAFHVTRGLTTGFGTATSWDWSGTRSPTNANIGPAALYTMTLANVLLDSTSPGVEVVLSCASKSRYNEVYRFDFDSTDDSFAAILDSRGLEWWTDGGDGWYQPNFLHRAVDLTGDGTDDLGYYLKDTGGGYIQVEFTGAQGEFQTTPRGVSIMRNIGATTGEKANLHVIALDKGGKEGFAWVDPTTGPPTYRFRQYTAGDMSVPTRRPMPKGDVDYEPGTNNTSAVGYFDDNGTADFLANALSQGVEPIPHWLRVRRGNGGIPRRRSRLRTPG